MSVYSFEAVKKDTQPLTPREQMFSDFDRMMESAGPHGAECHKSNIICTEALPDTRTVPDHAAPIAPLMRAEEVAATLLVHKTTVMQWAREGIIPSVKISRWVRFHRDVIAGIARNGLPTICVKSHAGKETKNRRVPQRGAREVMPWETKRRNTGA